MLEKATSVIDNINTLPPAIFDGDKLLWCCLFILLVTSLYTTK